MAGELRKHAQQAGAATAAQQEAPVQTLISMSKARDARKAEASYLPPRPTRLRANPRHLWGTVRVVKQYL